MNGLKSLAFILFLCSYVLSSAQEKGTFTDTRDGNEYKTVRIGNQVWMAENLNYLPQETGGCGYSSDESMYYIYDINHGVMCNYPAATDACPAGWHLPKNDEWEQLFEYINKEKGPFRKGESGNWNGMAKYLLDESVNGDSLKNEFGFSALLAGVHVPYGHHPDAPHCFEFFDVFGFWWAQRDSGAMDNAWELGTTDFDVSPTSGQSEGYSIRCIQD